MAEWIKSGENPQAAGTVTYGIEGSPAAMTLDSAGNFTVTGSISGASVVSPVQADFSVTGALTVTAYDFRWYNDTGRTLTFGTVRASVGVAPATTAVVVDVLKDGTTIFTTTGNRPSIAAGANTAVNSAAPDITTLPAGHYLTVSVVQTGTGTTGSDLTVQVNMS